MKHGWPPRPILSESPGRAGLTTCDTDEGGAEGLIDFTNSPG